MRQPALIRDASSVEGRANNGGLVFRIEMQDICCASASCKWPLSQSSRFVSRFGYEPFITVH